MRIRFASILFLATLAGGSVSAQVRPLTLDEAARMALERSPELKAGKADVDKAGAERSAVLGQMGPKFSIEAGIQRWGSASTVSFIDPASLPPPDQLAMLPDVFKDLLSGFGKPITTQDKVTGSVALQALQPLTPLYPLYEVYRIQGFAEDAARLTLAAAREQVRFRVAEAYFRLMAATRMAEVAQAAVETVEAHLKTARAFHEAGVVGRDDVLRAETALAKTRDGLSQAKAAVALCRAALNVLVGLPVNEPTVPSAQPADPPPEVRLSEEDCVQAALSKRGEVNAMHRRVEMADAGRQAAIGQMIPTVAALIRYNHQEGSKFMKADNWFVGAALSWNFWEWGATWYKVKSAASDGDKARSGVEAVRDGITLDVKKAYLDLRTSRSSIDFAKVAIASAEENLRVVTKKYEASTATSVEVLDAQTSLTQGRIQYQIALAAYYTALANLQRAIGQEL